MSTKYTWKDFSQVETGVNGAALNASTNMNPIPIAGADLVQLYLIVVNATGIALPIVGNLESRPKITFQTLGNWDAMQTRAIIAGVETWSNRTLAKTTPAVAATYRYMLSIDDIGPADQFRIGSITAAGAGATDLITIWARVRIPTN